MVDKTIAGGALRPLHNVQLGLLTGQGDGRHHVCETVDFEDDEVQTDSEHHPGLLLSQNKIVSHQRKEESQGPRDVAGQSVDNRLLQFVL